MQLEPGLRLAHYEISALLGKGGMGEVWRATDTKLGREVAIKVLPDEFTKDAERLARFEREARLLASLDHTNVASIHGIEETGGAKFLVMQLAPGEELTNRLQRGPVPVEEALEIAKQIAEALEAAHEQGIVHRDLKPANIKIGEDGGVKVLDFGLAKAFDSEGSEEEISNSPTMVRAATHAGVILGTAGYMSPEQARGKKVDRRADVWAFGVVLWEMLTGRRLFAGETVSDTLASVLRADVDLGLLPDNTPPAIRTLLRRCLERNPKNRLHDIADARIAIDDVLSGVGGEDAPATSGGSRARVPVWIGAVVVAGVLGAVAGYFARREAATVVEPRHLAISLAPEQELAAQVFEFSRDGRTLVFQGRENGRQTILARRLDEGVTRAVPGTEHGSSAFFSPDGTWIGFKEGSKLRKVPLEGGRPLALTDAGGSGGATWLENGTIIFAPTYSDGLFRLAAEGGVPERLTTPDRDDGVLGHWWPCPLPGERKILFTAFRTPVDRSRIGVLDLETNEVRWLVDGGFFARWSASGHLLYARENRLFAVPIDPVTAELSGTPVQVVDDVHVEHTNGSAAYAVSGTGTLAYVTADGGDPVRELVWLDRDGVPAVIQTARRRYRGGSLSPDGRHAALSVLESSLDVWVYSFERGTMSRLTSGEKSEFDATWTPDGKELVYVVDSPPFELFRSGAGETDGGRPLFDEKAEKDTYGISISPDGKTIAYTVSSFGTAEDIYVRSVDGTEAPRALRASRASERYPTFSPDGKWIAYRSIETGRPEIYAEALSGTGERIQVTAGGGDLPLWARNGEIFYLHFDEVWVVGTRSGDPIEVDEPRKLFSFPIAASINESRLAYDVTADGQRFLVSRIPDSLRPRHIEIVTDWTSKLK